jgi:hypothetical protein
MIDKSSLKERLIRSVRIDPEKLCWGGISSIIIDGKNISGPRLSAYAWDLFELEPELCVCHRCDNNNCINPAHMFIGTDKDNAQDCVIKNRKGGLRGDNWAHIPVLLTEEQFLRAVIVTKEHGFKTIPAMMDFAFKSLPPK